MRVIRSSTKNRNSQENELSNFSIAIRDIKELRKVDGLGWKAIGVVEWAMD